MVGAALRAAALGAILVVALLGPAAGEHHGERLSFDLIFEEEFAGALPGELHWAPDGKRLVYRWKNDGGDALWLFDLDGGDPERLLEIGEGSAALSLPDLESVEWSPRGDALLIGSQEDLFLLDLDRSSGSRDSKIRRLTETEAAEKNPRYGPRGERIAFVRDENLFVLDLESGAERALTSDGKENEILNGRTDWVYWEEIWGRTDEGVWWSPAGDRIAFYRFDDRKVPTYPLVDFTSRYPTVEWQRYPKAGDTNPVVSIGVVELDSGKITWLDTHDDPDVYLGRVDWRPSGDRVAVQRLNRDQNRLDLLLCAPASGECPTILTETAETWINLSEDLRFLPDNRFLWSSEETGWRQLALYSADGKRLRTLTPKGWTVTRVDALTDDRAVVYTGYRQDGLGALHRQVLSQDLSGGPPVALSPEDSWASANVASKTGAAVITSGSASRERRATVFSGGGRKAADLPSRSSRLPAHSPEWTFFSIPEPGGSALPAALLEPSGREAGIKHPVLMYHYGGPASQVVADRPTSQRDLWHRLMAQRGYGILLVDNLASNFFGKQGADRVHRRFGKKNLEAQLAAVEYLKTLDWVDAERIGLWGWSGGGSNTLYALLNSPGTWRAAVAGAPVTDWRLYDTIWTERYLDHPDDNPEGYRDSSAVTYADRLEDALLIVHGTADDNVHPQNTMVMSRALLDAGVPFEQAIHPRQKHGFRGGDARHLYERMTEFFDRHLAAAPQATR